MEIVTFFFTRTWFRERMTQVLNQLRIILEIAEDIIRFVHFLEVERVRRARIYYATRTLGISRTTSTPGLMERRGRTCVYIDTQVRRNCSCCF